MRSEGWGFDRLKRAPHPIAPRADAPTPDYFKPQSAKIPVPQPQPVQPSFDGIPAELRARIWAYAQEIVEAERRTQYYNKPKHSYAALPLVSRQIYHEAALHWQRSIVPSNRIRRFLYQPFSKAKLETFQSLSLELPFNLSPKYLDDLSKMLVFFAPRLENVQLFFTGNDAYGTRVYLHGCCNQRAVDPEEPKLPQDGQEFHSRIKLINALAMLTKLKILVVSNANLPLLQMQVLKNKPKLKKLCLISDPRSTLHLMWKEPNCQRGVYVSVREHFPPVKELQLSANAVIGAGQVGGKLSPTLEKLTWIVPDLSRQAGSLIQKHDWWHETGILLQNLRSNSKNLHTLRICVESSIYEGHASYGSFIGAFREHVPKLRIKNLELHIESKSPYMPLEFIEALPKTLERFYVSDRFVPIYHLVKWVSEFQLPGTTFDEDSEEFSNAVEIKPVTQTSEELARKDFIPIHEGNLGFVEFEYDTLHQGRLRMIEASDLKTPDVIHVTHETADIPEEDKRKALHNEFRVMGLLRLNGLLLDRERQKHLTCIPSSRHIPPRLESTLIARSGEHLVSLISTSANPINNFETKADDLDFGIDWSYMSATNTSDTTTNDAFFGAGSSTANDTFAFGNSNETSESGDPSTITPNAEPEFHFTTKSYDAYFGKEAEAERVFSAERVMKAEALAPRKYPMIVPCPTGYEENEHWMCC